MDSQSQRIAADEKRSVALASVLAAVGLTFGKLGVGLWTGSLGILAEAAHSGLDLIAAVITLVAVRASAKPADPEHTYGHGKVENLSALFETVLLAATCGWIIYEAVHRLWGAEIHVELSPWAFGVILISILVDYTRSRALQRAAIKYRSQALEADALHFSSDIWSSGVVLIGLLCVWISQRWALPSLASADALAALGVALIVIFISVRMGKKTINDLLDAVPPGLRDDVTRAANVPGVLEVSRVRVRRAGPETFADVTLKIKRDEPFERTHKIATEAEAAVQKIMPEADIVVHVEPLNAEDESAIATLRVLAARHGLGAHGITVSEHSGARSVDMHLEVNDRLRVDEAHQISNDFERELRQALPDLERITTHLEPVSEVNVTQRTSPANETFILATLSQLARDNQLACRPHSVKVNQVGAEVNVSLHCCVDPAANIRDAHALTVRLERLLRGQLPDLGRIVIHVEPAEQE